MLFSIRLEGVDLLLCRSVMTNKISGKTALVTGGSSGIGLATAELLSSLGADIWIIARDKERLQNALEQIRKARYEEKQRFGMTSADITDIKQARAAVAEAEKNLGHIDILINSAGDNLAPGLFHEIDVEQLRDTMELNYFGTINITNAALPRMIERKAGHIVNISSVYGFYGGFGNSAYCASKFAIRGLSDSLRAELKPQGINVTVVFPGDTDTPQLKREIKARTPVLKALNEQPLYYSPPIPVEKVAQMIVSGIIKKKYIILPGSKFLWQLIGFGYQFGYTYKIVDYLVGGALRKVKRSGN